MWVTQVGTINVSRLRSVRDSPSFDKPRAPCGSHEVSGSQRCASNCKQDAVAHGLPHRGKNEPCRAVDNLQQLEGTFLAQTTNRWPTQPVVAIQMAYPVRVTYPCRSMPVLCQWSCCAPGN